LKNKWGLDHQLSVTGHHQRPNSSALPGILAAAIVALVWLGLNVGMAQTGPIPPPSGLVAWWPGDGNASDIVGTNNAILAGGATFTTGIVGQAFALNGADAQVLATAISLPIGSADRSIEFWVRIDQFVATFPNEAFFCGYGRFGLDGQTYHTGTLGGQSGQLFWSSWGFAIPGSPMTNGLWYHVAVTSSGGLTTLYLNGMQVGSDSQPFDTPDGTAFIMGYLDPGRTLEGALDEVSVYSRALSADEILAIYQAGSAGKIKPAPQLQISAASNIALIWWSTNASGFVLESSPSLGTSQNWNTFPGPVRILADQNVVATDTANGSRFFRLRRP
jgi:hypothetical protein